jgi:hypothetical protein
VESASTATPLSIVLWPTHGASGKAACTLPTVTKAGSKNSEFGNRVSEFKAQKGTSLNFLITKLLAEHWEVPFPTPETDT